MEIRRRVRDAMSTPVLAVAPDITVADVAQVLTEHSIGAVPVVGPMRQVVGVIAESDLVRWMEDPDSTAAAVMSAPAVTIAADAPLENAREALTAHAIGRLPVVDRWGRLIGILSRRDLLRALIPADSAIRRHVMERSAGFEVEVAAVTVSRGSVWLRVRVGNRAAVALLEESLRLIAGVTRIDVEIGCPAEQAARGPDEPPEQPHRAVRP
jgi:CBS domain-containing protein